MQRALVSVLLLGVVAPAVGTWVVLRRLAYMGEAMAHGLLAGVAAAALLGASLTLGAFVAAGTLAALVGLLVRRAGVSEDAAIGTAETALFALGVILLHRQGGGAGAVSLSHVLFGNVLAVSGGDLVVHAVCAVVVLGGIAVLLPDLIASSFDPVHARTVGVPTRLVDGVLLGLLALVIVVALQSVGLLMSVAMLVVPASAARLVAPTVRSMLAVAIAFGIGAGAVGFLVSYHLGTPSGATIALAASGVFACTWAVRAMTRIHARVVAA